MPSPTTTPGYTNPNNQRVVRDTGRTGTDHCQTIVEMECLDCGIHYGTNSSNCHQCKCVNQNGTGVNCGQGRHEDLL
jgi:hypothetical protein